MSVLKNKNGISYILVCVVLLFAVMLIFVGLQYSSALYVIEQQKYDTEFKLKAIITEYAYECYENGTEITEDELEARAYEVLGFAIEGVQSKDGDGYIMSRPSFSVFADSDVRIVAEYELTVYFEALEGQVIDILVPISVTAQYYER